MRIYEDRYSRERLRFQLALRFIRLEARTHTIRQWTGLSDDRIRKLYRSYLAHSSRALPRHRGKSPQRVGIFLRSARLRQESSLLATLFRLLGALPMSSAPPSLPGVRVARAAGLPSPPQAQLLCEAYELYRTLLGAPALGFEHAVFLLQALRDADEITTDHCPECQALVVADRWALFAPRCFPCAQVGAVDQAEHSRARSSAADPSAASLGTPAPTL